MKFRIDLLGELRNIADLLETGNAKDLKFYRKMYAFALREAAANIEALFRNRDLLDQFADVYCLTPDDLGAASTGAPQ
ncbi:MAG: hypothetical protein IT472_08985 [Thermomonas sp.]|uniref:hypothetical protein n=1 Tax=Thermomonas sp. TaxID=1971895 RepID=UPI002619BD78|nr:hypothetical protein [Thermomonas sp.]MCC7097300.1 hypothetical protein [Thermomonas sp.]